MRPFVCRLLVFSILFLFSGAAGSAPVEKAANHFLTGRLLVSAKGMADPRFAESLVYIIDHSERGATGLIINKPVLQSPLSEVMANFGINYVIDALKDKSIPLYYGGPVDGWALFVLHTGDYASDGTKAVTGQYSITLTKDVLEAIANGKGPDRWLFIGGYAGWGPGQLENEFSREDWLVAPASEALLFGSDNASKWQRALSLAGLDL